MNKKSTAFDLERFIAGEPAYDKYNNPNYYVGKMPSGRIIAAWQSLDGDWRAIPYEDKNADEWTMKPIEEWHIMSLSTTFYNEKDARHLVEIMNRDDSEPKFQAVRIIRDN